jgi:hypothetical protein
MDALEALISKSGNVVNVFMTTQDDSDVFMMLLAANDIRVTNGITEPTYDRPRFTL